MFNFFYLCYWFVLVNENMARQKNIFIDICLLKNKNNFNISSYKAVGECYDPVLSYLFAREDHIVTETAKNTKEIVMVSKLNR